MRIFPNTKSFLATVSRVALGLCFMLLAAPSAFHSAEGQLWAAGPQPTGGTDEDDPTYPKPPEIDDIWEADSPATTLYAGMHASGIGYQYWNNYMLMETIWERLRNVPLVTYNGEDGAGSPGMVPGNGGYGSVPADQVGGYRYSTGGYPTAPYGTGYAPGYEEGQPLYQTGYPYYQDGIMYNPYAPQQPYYQQGAAPVYRGQAAYGDPGTLIYSLWGGVVGGSGKVKDHASAPGYKTKDFGGYIGIDLFGSTDCRSGLFYAYQKNELKQEHLGYTYLYNQRGILYDPTTIVGVGEEKQYSTEYDYKLDFSGTFDGKLKGHNHLIGLYHQFGSEFIYNIATARFGFNRMKSKSVLSESGTADETIGRTVSTYLDGEQVDPGYTEIEQLTVDADGLYNMSSKYNEYLGGVSLERGANLKFLNVFTFSPRGTLDYTYLFRDKIKETVDGVGVNYYKKKSYHSLRSQLGADLALDLYPGDGHFRVLARGGWIHEFLSFHYGKTMLTDVYGTEWEGKGNPAGRDWAVLGAGAEWTIVPAFMIFADYDYYKNKYLGSHYGDAGVKLMW